MTRLILLGVLGISLLLFIGSVDADRRDGTCPWLVNNYKNSSCPVTNFLCLNGQCIERRLFCNGRYDCRDQTDETYCNSAYNCPKGMKLCETSRRCIPEVWFCDGHRDCSYGEDETSCEAKDNVQFAVKRALQWLYSQRKDIAGETWGKLASRSAVALYSADSNFTKNNTRREMAYEISIQFLSLLSRNKLQDIPSTDLASFVNAFLVSCLDPRKFHGVDIIGELRSRVDRQNNTSPYVLLSLCNAGDTITESDKLKLIDTFWNSQRTFWTDTQAVAVMALACASKQPKNEVDSKTISELTLELKQHQYRNGTVENVQTTALVLQALFSAEPNDDPDNFDETKALNQILSSQKPDGSFGSFMNTYFVLPVLSCRSLVNISSDHCHFDHPDEISALDNLNKLTGPKKRVQYSLWIGEDKDLERNMALRVPANMSFYGLMEIAAEIDNRFNFEYVVKNRKPYINAISGLQDDPERGRFWFMYKIEGGKPKPTQESPVDVNPKNNDHFVMWYRIGSWID